MSDGEPRRGGRPRSERARIAVLHAVDDLLVEVGYADMTLKGIAERAGGGRQTLYRWWSTKAEILFEATIYDAAGELAVDTSGEQVDVIAAYLDALAQFLAYSPAGLAYRALVGEAQHDPAVAELLASSDILGDSARAVLPASAMAAEEATALLIGPTFFWVLGGRDPEQLDSRRQAELFLRRLGD